MDKNYNIYLGIVVQNNDPEMRGRVKIYIPQLAPTITKLNENVDKFFAFLGGQETKNQDLIKVVDDLKDSLSWSEYAGPICGGNASGRYNAFLQTGTTSDSNAWVNDQVAKGFRPAQNFIDYQAYPDAFNETDGHKNKFVNEYSHQYTPANYSGFARGLFSIPNVGAHVYVFFVNGDRNFSVYFASAYSQEDIKRIFTLSQDVNDNGNVDYPASYENIGKNQGNPTLTHNNKTFRSKTVLNSNKNTIELVDTDLKEMIRLTHYSGSFKEFNNKVTIELATGNDQKMVLGDQFLTTQKNKSEYVRVHSELIVGGDHYINIGETDQQKVKDILNIHREIHEYKLLFDVRRAQYGEATKYGNPNDMSKYQTRSGTTGEIGGAKYKEGFVECPVCKGLPYDPYDPTYGQDIYEMWKEAPIFLPPTCLSIGAEPADVTSGAGAEGSMGNFGPTCHSIMFPGEEEPPEGCLPQPHRFQGLIGYYRGMKCSCCKGTGYSPATELGDFNKETHKQPNGTLDNLILSKSPSLFKLEKELGEGGDQIITISMNKIETIGLVMNSMKSFRVDPIGKLKIDGCWVAPQGTYDTFKPSPHVEYVDVSDIPGGDYNLTVMNKYKLLVGARGINIETHGPMDIYGSIVNFTGEQVNISSKNEVVIDGGERITIRGRKISLLPVEHNAVVVEGQLHITRNAIIEGGMMFEGEVGLLHITAPLEWQQTEIGLWDPEPSETCTVMILIPELADAPLAVNLPNHRHYFKNVPLTLLPHAEAVREAMITKGINSRNKVAAASRAANPEGCSSETLNTAQAITTPVAWEKAKEQATSMGINADKDWARWDAGYQSGSPIGGGPMTMVSSGTGCVTQESQTTVTAKYFWYWGGKSDYITVSVTLNSDGEAIEGPTAT